MPKVKKTSQVIHPNSRKALQMARQVFHNERVDKRKEETNTKQKSKLIKFKWFKDNIDVTKDSCSAEEVKDLIERYLNRFNDVLKDDEIKSLKRHISSSTFQDYKCKFLIEKEKQEFDSRGLEVPEMMQKKAYSTFKVWNGDAQLLPAITTITISKKQLEKSIPTDKISDQAT